ncbi:hypothetical protein Pelo_19381 [Pelomyxa schiedti]|nr:hypothetical protein Pelo_19381 [Pelomyxa schiedti]
MWGKRLQNKTPQIKLGDQTAACNLSLGHFRLKGLDESLVYGEIFEPPLYFSFFWLITPKENNAAIFGLPIKKSSRRAEYIGIHWIKNTASDTVFCFEQHGQKLTGANPVIALALWAFLLRPRDKTTPPLGSLTL